MLSTCKTSATRASVVPQILLCCLPAKPVRQGRQLYLKYSCAVCLQTSKTRTPAVPQIPLSCLPAKRCKKDVSCTSNTPELSICKTSAVYLQTSATKTSVVPQNNTPVLSVCKPVQQGRLLYLRIILLCCLPENQCNRRQLYLRIILLCCLSAYQRKKDVSILD